MDPSLRLSCPETPTDPAEQPILARTPYCSLVGSLMYLAIGTRPDIAYSMHTLCRFLDCYRTVHWEATKCVVCYLKGTRDLHLHLGGDHVARLLGSTDSDFALCTSTHKSISGYCFSLGSRVITWCAKQQPIVTLSTCEAKYVAACEASRELI